MKKLFSYMMDANLEDIVPYAVVTLFHARQQFYEQLKKA